MKVDIKARREGERELVRASTVIMMHVQGV